MKQKIRTASLLLLMVLGTGLVLMACDSKSLADSRTAGSDSLQGAGGTASGSAEYADAYRSSDSVLMVRCSSFRGRPSGAALSSHRKGYLRWNSYRHVCC